MGEPKMMFSNISKILRNATLQKQMEKLLFVEMEQYKDTLLSIGDGVISTDIQGNILFINKMTEKLTGWTQVEAHGKPLESVFQIINEFTRDTYESPVSKIINAECTTKMSNNTILISKTDKETYIEFSTAPIKNKDEQITGAVIVIRDITEKKKKQNHIEYLSFHDYLTGLYNRRYLEDSIKRLDTKRNLPFTIMVLDVNGLKLTNDAFGHKMGDNLLKKVAELLRKVCRTDDIISRIGGDEFVVLLPNTDETQAEIIKERFNIEASKVDSDVVIVSLAIGHATKKVKEQGIIGIHKEADNRMYKNKLSSGQSMRIQTIETLLLNINNKSEREQIHTEMVSQYSVNIAKTMKLSNKELDDVKIAGILHDIGKIIVPAELLNKPTILTSEEFEIIKRHSETGYQNLKGVDEYSSLASIVLYQHERWDGKGYPQGLKGESIPLLARIVAVADAYEAMTSQSSYQKAKGKKEAIEELEKCSGTQFDPEIVKVFLEMVI